MVTITTDSQWSGSTKFFTTFSFYLHTLT